MILGRLAMAAAACAVLAGPARAAATAADVTRAAEAVDVVARGVMRLPAAPPGLAIVVVRPSGKPLILTYGRADLASDRPVTAHTRFYVASMTKAYTGLLAADLDRTGVLPLDSRLDEVWPGLEIPGQGDLKATTLRSWMSHQAPIANDTLNFVTGFVRPVAARDYPAMLATWSSDRPAGFRYSNTGYLVYAAALEARTGRPLPDWMGERVFRPLGLSETSMRISDVPARDLATGYVFSPRGEWTPAPAKTDGLMHAAGGIVTTPGDMGKWLEANLRRQGRGLARADFDRVRAPNAPMKASREGFDCGGYGLGWYVCDYGGRRVLSHGGGYTGHGALMTLAPDEGTAIAVLANGDTAGLAFSTALTRIFLNALDPRRSTDPLAEMAAIAEGLAGQRERFVARAAKVPADPAFGDWSWRPAPDALAAYAGRYASARLGDLDVAVEDGRGVARLGQMAFDLKPAAPDVFGAATPGEPEPAVFRFERDAGGRVTALLWGARRFERR